MMVDTKQIIRMLQRYLDSTPLDFWNEYTAIHSRIERKTIWRIIGMIKALED